MLLFHALHKLGKDFKMNDISQYYQCD